MLPQNLILNPHFSSKFPNPLLETLPRSHLPPSRRSSKIKIIQARVSNSDFFLQNANQRPDLRAFAGRSKDKSGGTSGGRIEGYTELRREAKRNARRRSRKMAESLFYRLKNPHKNFPDNFTEEELQMIGLGYDRMVRFMEKDDPNLKHPYDWYKYGEFGPYSWRGVVLGDPVRGRFSDERVAMMGEVRDQEEWEKIEQYDMGVDFQKKLDSMDSSKRKRYYWVFVRHPKWRVADLPWQQWTLACEVAVEAGDHRLDKWTLMGRFGNNARALITKCAAWVRPDIIYVKRPVYQCRFEPQDEFFAALAPLLDPESEEEYMCERKLEDGSMELCTYFAGLCRILRVNPKAFVDDVVKAYEKSSDERKSECLEFLLGNHPVMLLHPYTKEWKAKLEEMELGCDAPDDDDDDSNVANGNEIIDWVEDDGGNYGTNDDYEDDEDDAPDDTIDDDEEDEGSLDPKEDIKYWDEAFKKAVRSNEAMEKMVEISVNTTSKFYAEQRRRKEEMEGDGDGDGDGDELEMRGKRAKISREEWKVLGYGPYRKRVKKSKIPPELFLRAAVRPFTYRNLVKEIVLTRHAILEGEIGPMKKNNK
ncbi:uncharacterized protein LOC127247681 [Andrographis paniculata]|uniref:uncharacterized protein LOC127247681 n=1 Tax=Andrographis paniculata TaxID=175694 RepID=UPI0021E84D40|nr:uncharacterized protein LOC127247681 [Andrographis paniculata]XP_051125602.1 uncharacterized protein LOC127247681 [Andrographis paniculata]XP_051125603.1 uncharacterized protein LOC127247681 [Andrographis paniculata]